MQLLIVDDDPFVGRALARHFSSTELSTTDANTPEAALRLLDTQPFDAVLVDYNLGGGPNGLDLLRIVSTSFPGVRRLLMSSQRVIAWHGLAERFLSKPLAPTRIVQVLLSNSARWVEPRPASAQGTPTPAAVEACLRREARVAIDEGGLFVSVDGGGKTQLGVVRAALDAAMPHAEAAARVVAPRAVCVASVPLCHGAIQGVVRHAAREPVIAVLRARGYVVK